MTLRAIIEGKGYDADVWTFQGIAKFPPEPVIKNLHVWIEKEKHFLPGSCSALLMQIAEEKLSDIDKDIDARKILYRVGYDEEKLFDIDKGRLFVGELKEVLADLEAVIDTAIEECGTVHALEDKRRHWEKKAKRDLSKIYGG